MELHSEGFYSLKYESKDGVGYCKPTRLIDKSYEVWTILALRKYPGLRSLYPSLTTVVLVRNEDYAETGLEVRGPLDLGSDDD
jgi:hypothetical protein